MRCVVAALIALALVPAMASAQAPPTNAPSGNSAIDEYLETVPGARGDRVPGPPGAAALPSDRRERLEQLGADGEVLADVIDSTAPAPPAKGADRPDVRLPEGSGRSPIAEVLSVAEGDGGMGVVLPAILFASVLAAIALVLVRRRSTS